MNLTADQIFTDAARSCKKEITREAISKIISTDKTNTIRKYLNSYGLTQLALKLQKLALDTHPARSLIIKINDNSDGNQMSVQKVAKAVAEGIPAKAKKPQPVGFSVSGTQSSPVTFASAESLFQEWGKQSYTVYSNGEPVATIGNPAPSEEVLEPELDETVADEEPLLSYKSSYAKAKKLTKSILNNALVDGAEPKAKKGTTWMPNCGDPNCNLCPSTKFTF